MQYLKYDVFERMEHVYMKYSNYSDKKQILKGITILETHATDSIHTIDSFNNFLKLNNQSVMAINTSRNLSKLHNMIFIYLSKYLSSLQYRVIELDIEKNNMNNLV